MSGESAESTAEDRGCLISFLIATASVLFLVTLVPYLFSYLILDYYGQHVTAVVRKLSETVSIREDVASRRLRVITLPVGEEAEISIPASTATFDRLRVGQIIVVRRPSNPALLAIMRPPAEIAGQGWEGRARYWREEAWPLFTMLWSGWVGILLAGAFSRIMKSGCAFFLLYSAAWLGYWLSPLSDDLPAGELKGARAKVFKVELVTKLGDTEDSSGFPLLRNYLMVGFEFTPEGWTHSVKAVDRIDSRSMPEIHGEEGVEIHYQSDAPRRARLAGGRRTYWWKNLFFWGPYAAVIVAGWTIWRVVWCRKKRAGP
jgi:hypothetical protein